MPELPEVETVRRGLEKTLKKKTIECIELRRAGLRKPFPKSLKTLRDVKIIRFRRRAKYLVIDLDNGQSLILHLGMSGRLLLAAKNENKELQKHDHVVLHMNDGSKVIFNDARRFGILDIAPTTDIESHPLFAHLGPEPLDVDLFNAQFLHKKIASRKSTPIKVAIMDQEVVVGVGNIYASESLFLAKIDPRRLAASLTLAECRKLVENIRIVLEKSIAAGGSSLRDYVQTDGELGYFQHHFAVYGRGGETCTHSGCARSKKDVSLIEKITQGGRSTFFCPRCQT